MTQDRLFFKFTAQLSGRELLTNQVSVKEGVRGKKQSMAAVDCLYSLLCWSLISCVLMLYLFITVHAHITTACKTFEHGHC